MEARNGGDPRKLFVGGLPHNATKESVTNYFNQFGDVMIFDIVTHPVTKRSKGFGFVYFQSVDSAQRVLNHAEHIIDGKKVDVKTATPKSNGASSNNDLSVLDKKLFVGGLPHECTSEELKEHFDSFGPVLDALVIVSPQSRISRGFGFVTFESSAAADKAIKDRFQVMKSKLIEVKPAELRTTYNYIPNNVTDGSNGNEGPSSEAAGIVQGHDMSHLQYYNHNGFYNGESSFGYIMPQYNYNQQIYNCWGMGFGHPVYPYGYLMNHPFYNPHGYSNQGSSSATQVPLLQQNSLADQPQAEELIDPTEHQSPMQNSQDSRPPAKELTDAQKEQSSQQNGQTTLPAEEELSKPPEVSTSENISSPHLKL